MAVVSVLTFIIFLIALRVYFEKHILDCIILLHKI
jgi:hypothetical protein